MRAFVRKLRESAFGKLVGKLERKGDSAESARKIAAAAGDKKLGTEEMARRSAAARERNEGR